MTGLKIIVALEAVTLVLTVALVLQSEGQKSFPSSVAVPPPSHLTAVAPVAISVDLGSRGTTVTTALALGRGGQAVSRPLRASSSRLSG
jgi:hypothetical protein